MSQEASFTFTTPLNVNLVNLKGEEHLFVEGDISTNDIDLVNDIMTKECQESMQRQMLERTFKLDLEHEAFRGPTHEAKEIAKTKIPAGKIIDSTVKDLGQNRFSTSVKGEINRHNPNYKSIKGNLTEGYLDAFSVAFLPTDVTYDVKDGERIRMLNDVKLLNVALTGNPCNTKAQLSDIFMKSMDAVEEYKRMKAEDPDIEQRLEVKSHSIPNGSEEKKTLQIKLNNKEKKMTEKNLKEEPTAEAPAKAEVKPEGTEENVESKALLNLNAELINLKSENVTLKDAVTKIAEQLDKITKALEKPIHKSEGVQIKDAEVKANASETKSVDPLSLFR